MSNNSNDGGPAFPVTEDNLNNYGMSIRDYFAAKAMEAEIQARDGIPQAGSAGTPQLYWLRWIARDAYAMADVMLAARQGERHDDATEQ
jgi:hypothetical protein